MEAQVNFVCQQQTEEKKEQQKHTFYNPYTVLVLEGGATLSQRPEVELVAILSSN